VTQPTHEQIRAGVVRDSMDHLLGDIHEWEEGLADLDEFQEDQLIVLRAEVIKVRTLIISIRDRADEAARRGV